MTDIHSETKNEVISHLKEVFDPEIPVNIYDIGLIYDIEITEDFNVNITMTLTSPNCPVADVLPVWVEEEVKEINDIKDVYVHLTWDPPWTMDMMSTDAKTSLGIF